MWPWMFAHTGEVEEDVKLQSFLAYSTQSETLSGLSVYGRKLGRRARIVLIRHFWQLSSITYDSDCRPLLHTGKNMTGPRSHGFRACLMM